MADTSDSISLGSCRHEIGGRGGFVQTAYLGDHHVAVKGALAVRRCRSLDVGADFGHHGRAEGDVGHEVAVHDVDVKPCRSVVDRVGTCFA